MHVETVILKPREKVDRRGDAEQKFLEALKLIDLNGAGILKASVDNDPSRIVVKREAFKSAMRDLENAWQDIWFRHECFDPNDESVFHYCDEHIKQKVRSITGEIPTEEQLHDLARFWGAYTWKCEHCDKVASWTC